MRRISVWASLFLVITMHFACKEQNTEEKEQAPLVSVKTVQIYRDDIENYLSLNGKTVYLKRNAIVSPITGYVVKIDTKYGEAVHRNEVLFEIQTKENKALENTDGYNRDLGIIKVVAPANGIIDALDINESGSYVTEGGSLCSIVENSNLMVRVNVPFEYNVLLKTGARCKLLLPDNSSLEGVVSQILPQINEADQTQTALIKPSSQRALPENLNLIAQFVIAKHSGSMLVPKDALMTNETQSMFWVMKVVNDTLAVKIPVTKGIENDSQVEIKSTVLNTNDTIISSGAYGLPDSTTVKIVN